MIRRLFPALLLASAACVSEQPPERAAPGAASAFQPSDAAAASATGEAYLVWSADSAGAPATTVWIDGEGREVARRPGVLVAAGGGLWAWREEKERTKGIDCDCLRETEFTDDEQASYRRCTREADVAVVDLVDLLGGRRVRVLDTMSGADTLGIEPPEQSSAPLAGVGPFLFTESDSYTYSCGAHGFHGVDAEVYDLLLGARVEMMDSVEAEAATAREGADAIRRMIEEDADLEDPRPVEVVDLTEVEARWTPAGKLEVAYQFTTGACYACGDGLAGSYTRSAVIPAKVLPKRLAEWTTAPEAVRRYWQSAPPGARSGWSRVDAPDRAAALARFRAP
ncbi:MAG TPA: hypothetical protein VF746_07380 [Longimicrobium sp.]|jgi:hypothetical protein